MSILITILKVLLILTGGFLALNILFFLVLWIISLTVDRKPITELKPVYHWGCTAFCTWAVGMAGVRTHFTGIEKLPKEQRFLLVSNHRALYDPLTLGYKLHAYDLAFISKPGNMRLPVIGRLSYGAGYLALDRENNREALKTILTAADYLEKGICSMGIYPEGTRSKEEGMLPFRPGAFKIAKKAKSPVAVVASKNTDLVFKNVPFHRTDVYVDILEVLSPEQVAAMSTAELSEYAHRRISEHLYGRQEPAIEKGSESA